LQLTSKCKATETKTNRTSWFFGDAQTQDESCHGIKSHFKFLKGTGKFGKKNYVKYELQLTRYAYAHPTQLRMCTVTHKQIFSSKGKGHMNILSKVAAFPP